jgi:site-specific DNA recombinase
MASKVRSKAPSWRVFSDRFDVLVIPRLDRLGRNYTHMTEVKGKLDDADVALVCLDPQIDFSTGVGLLVWANLTAVAQLESGNISERVAAVSVARAQRGRHHGGPRPYGYEHRDGELVVVPDEALIVARIYDRFLAGQSQRKITQDLIADGVPALKTQWTQSTISRILRSPIYRGQVWLRGVTYDADHTPIVTEDTWNKVAELRGATTRTKLAGRGKPSKRFLLTRGHLRCGCGAAMTGSERRRYL